jgi:hypothetical protein
MKTLGRTMLWSACAAVLLAAPLRAEDGADGGPDAGPPPADSPAPPPPPPSPRDAAPRGPAPGRGGWNGPGDSGGKGDGDRSGPGWRGTWGRGGPDPDVVEKMKKAAELDRKIEPLAVKMRGAAAGAQAAAKAELRKAVVALFDAKIELAEAEQKALEKKAAEMKIRIQKRKTAREALIDKKLEELAGDEEDDWD